VKSISYQKFVDQLLAYTRCGEHLLEVLTNS